MALPVNNVNQVGGAEVVVSKTHLLPQKCEVHRQEYKQIFQHYIEVNARSAAPSFSNTGGFDVYQEGWYHIDYTRLHASISQADRDIIKLSAKKYRVVNQGFKIKRINCIQQQIPVGTSTTAINASFQSAPSVIVFKDTDNDIFQATYLQSKTLAAGSECIWADDAAGPNDDYTTPYSATLVGGSLKEVKISRPNGVATGLADRASNFSLLHGGDCEWISPGEDKYHHHWENKSGNWHSPSIAAGNAALGENAYQLVTGMVDNTVQMVENTACGVPEPNVDIPQMLLIRAPPVRDALGLISMVFELMIEYYSTIEWVQGRYLGTFNHGVAIPTTIVNQKRWYNLNRRGILSPIADIPTVKTRQTGRKETPYKRPSDL